MVRAQRLSRAQSSCIVIAHITLVLATKAVTIRGKLVTLAWGLVKAVFQLRVFHTHMYARKTLNLLHFTYFKTILTNRH